MLTRDRNGCPKRRRPIFRKSPYFCHYSDVVLGGHDTCIDHVLVPICDSKADEDSRRNVVRSVRSQTNLLDNIRGWLDTQEITEGLSSTRSHSRGH